ncbi:MAG: DUF2851 family protein [Bacteroidota bacterium]|nr:DUF2851 family protein [Bacteroidota bacterium]
MKANEQLLQYLWKYKLYPISSLVTTDGREVEVIDPGIQNLDAGPDFFNAKVKIGEQHWAGNVEIHGSSSDWLLHGHHRDKLYNSVILHLAEKVNREVVNEAGWTVPQCRLEVPPSLLENAEFLIHGDNKLPCQSLLCLLPEKLIETYLPRLATERLERKTDDVFKLLERFKNSWDEVFYVMLSRNFGFGVNADAFYRLALSLPFNYLLKHQGDIVQLEALLFGQAGFLDDPITPNGQDGSAVPSERDDYYLKLREEYRFLKAKYSLKSLKSTPFKRLRVRPRSFPELRIAQMASLLHSSGRLFSVILKEETYDGMLSHFQTEPSGYWKSHFAFGKASKDTPKRMGKGSIEGIVINTVAPILFAYGTSLSDVTYRERAINFLELTKPEKNATVKAFEKGGVTPRNGADSQALIQLAREYCDKRKCFYCRIGHTLLSSGEKPFTTVETSR